ncbi:hypothetical protein [Streptomyces sp. NPDC093269]|uniref:hypothetical protein n=1 Tax=Streptomyces sp. NPDC093269 TaxID=3366038 RepID=UPI003804A431
MSLYLSPLAGSDLGDTLDDLAEVDDRDIARITAAIARIATRARNGHLSRQHTQLLLASIGGSPDGLDLVGALGLLIADLTTNNPALDELTDDARKDAERHGQEAALILQHDDLRRAASDACESLDHTN